MKIPTSEIQNAIVELYADFQASVMSNKSWSEPDMSFEEFMRWLIRNNPQ